MNYQMIDRIEREAEEIDNVQDLIDRIPKSRIIDVELEDFYALKGDAISINNDDGGESSCEIIKAVNENAYYKKKSGEWFRLAVGEDMYGGQPGAGGGTGAGRLASPEDTRLTALEEDMRQLREWCGRWGRYVKGKVAEIEDSLGELKDNVKKLETEVDEKLTESLKEMQEFVETKIESALDELDDVKEEKSEKVEKGKKSSAE